MVHRPPWPEAGVRGARAPDGRLQDDGGLTLFLDETTGDVAADGVVLTFQVDDVEETHHRLAAAGVSFVAPPGKRFWGYGAELRDPDGHLMLLWDEVSMRENDG